MREIKIFPPPGYRELTREEEQAFTERILNPAVCPNTLAIESVGMVRINASGDINTPNRAARRKAAKIARRKSRQS